MCEHCRTEVSSCHGKSWHIAPVSGTWYWWFTIVPHLVVIFLEVKRWEMVIITWSSILCVLLWIIFIVSLFHHILCFVNDHVMCKTQNVINLCSYHIISLSSHHILHLCVSYCVFQSSFDWPYLWFVDLFMTYYSVSDFFIFVSKR